ncbi:MAG: ATP-binding protein [Paludibacteraceae bacterium]|nr:ATP-binding protein [Paludibacteraceae bacterium]MBQ6764380.1 ATP-binding protein [Paludibacteraceae bacterium]
MERQDLQPIINTYHNFLSTVTLDYVRPLMNKIEWEDRLIEIKGSKGVGKTTLILQHIRMAFPNVDDTLYVSLDNLWFKSHTLKELADWLYAQGVRYLFLDEVHYYPHWQTAIKNLIDEYAELHIVFTGSSMLQLEAGEGDLSRRMIDYRLPGLSFREYLQFEGVAEFPSCSIEDILQKHVPVSFAVKEKLGSIQPYFNEYLEHGYYPFYKAVRSGYEIRLQHIVNQVLERDYPMIDDVTVPTIEKTKKMLMVLAQNVPQMPTMSTLYGQLETGRNQGLKMLYALQRADLLMFLSDNTKNLKTLGRPEKIFLHNTNLMYALGAKIEIGTVRETFFLNQLSEVLPVCYPAKGDFLVDNKYLFEVGGANKTFEQIKDVPDSFLAVDNTETGYKNRIPLWLFGFLY